MRNKHVALKAQDIVDVQLHALVYGGEWSTWHTGRCTFCGILSGYFPVVGLVGTVRSVDKKEMFTHVQNPTPFKRSSSP